VENQLLRIETEMTSNGVFFPIALEVEPCQQVNDTSYLSQKSLVFEKDGIRMTTHPVSTVITNVDVVTATPTVRLSSSLSQRYNIYIGHLRVACTCSNESAVQVSLVHPNGTVLETFDEGPMTYERQRSGYEDGVYHMYATARCGESVGNTVRLSDVKFPLEKNHTIEIVLGVLGGGTILIIIGVIVYIKREAKRRRYLGL